LADGDLSRAEQRLEQIKGLPGADEAANKVGLKRAEFEELVRGAEAKAQQLDFAEAVNLYEKALSIDKTNSKVLTALGQANADKNKLARLDVMLVEANEFVEGRLMKKLSAKFQDIQSEAQNNPWRQIEISRLKGQVEKLKEEFRSYKDTFEQAVDK
jgi:hypothetical protein